MTKSSSRFLNRFCHSASSMIYFTLLTNEVGEYIFLSNEDFQHFVDGELDEHSELFYDLASKQIATTDKIEDVVQMLATKFRTKKSILRDFTSLHMIVPTLRSIAVTPYLSYHRKVLFKDGVMV